MKKFIFIALIIVLLCRFLYPHTRAGWQGGFELPANRRLNIQNATLKPGEKITLKLIGIRKLVTYSSSDFRIAAVSPSGTVHAISPGTAIIYARQGKNEYRCKITVRK